MKEGLKRGTTRIRAIPKRKISRAGSKKGRPIRRERNLWLEKVRGSFTREKRKKKEKKIEQTARQESLEKAQEK